MTDSFPKPASTTARNSRLTGTDVATLRSIVIEAKLGRTEATSYVETSAERPRSGEDVMKDNRLK